VAANSARFVFAWIVAAGLLFRGGNAIRESLEARNWPTIPAVVTESDALWVEHHQAVKRSMWNYELHLRYAYTIGGREYIGSRASFSAWGPTENFNPLNSTIAHRYPVGARVSAHYDPSDYSRSVLQPVARLSAWIAFSLGILLARLGLVYARRVEREKKRVTPTILSKLFLRGRRPI
jgi:Protein of unknown function (DUF3592)